MEFSSLMLPSTAVSKNICRTCLTESDMMLLGIQDLVEHDMVKVKLIDILVYLNCLENNDEDNWPQGMCTDCVSKAQSAYSFKLNCLKANSTLSQILSMNNSPNIHQSDIDSIDINVVYQDHLYGLPLFSNNTVLDFDSDLPENKELIPLPPVSEITATEQLMRKEGEKKYTCSICPRSFTRIYGLRYHMERHNEVRRHLCPKCGKGFHSSSGMRQHLQSHKDVGQFKCGFCSKNYKSRQSLKEHFRVAHSSNRKLFVCTLCGKNYTAKSTLLMHMKTHDGLRQFACSECPKSYTRASYLRLHKLVHTGQERPKPFSCHHENCGRKFPTKHSLSVHIAHTHSSLRPYKCDICSKCFATLPGLKIHRVSHSDNVISCNVCGKRVANKRILQKHVRSHNVDGDSNDMIFETVINNAFLDHVYDSSVF